MDFKEYQERIETAVDEGILEKDEANRLLEGIIFANQKI